MITWPNIPSFDYGQPQADSPQAPESAAVDLPAPSENNFFKLIEQMLVPSSSENAMSPDDGKVEKNFPEKETKEKPANALTINPSFIALAGPTLPVLQPEISFQKGGTGDPPVPSGDSPLGTEVASQRVDAFQILEESPTSPARLPGESGGLLGLPKVDEKSRLVEAADQPEPTGNANSAIASKVKQKGNSFTASHHSFGETAEAHSVFEKVVGVPIPKSADLAGELPTSAGKPETPIVFETQIDPVSDDNWKTFEAEKTIPAAKPILPGPFETTIETPVGSAEEIGPETKPVAKLPEHMSAPFDHIRNHPARNNIKALPFANTVENTENVRLPENVSVVSEISADDWPGQTNPAPSVGVSKTEVADKQGGEPGKNIANTLNETISPKKTNRKQVLEKSPDISSSPVAEPIRKAVEEAAEIFRGQDRIADPTQIVNSESSVAMSEGRRAHLKSEVRESLNETKKSIEETELTTRGLQPRTHRPNSSTPADLKFRETVDSEFHAAEAVSKDTAKQSSAATQPNPVEHTSSKNDFPDSLKKNFVAAEILKSAQNVSPEPPSKLIHSTSQEHEHSARSVIDPAPAISPDGKEAAKQDVPMKFTEERNKFAERTLQKLPRFDFGEKQSGDSVKTADAKSTLEKSERKDQSSSTLPVLDWLPDSRVTDSAKSFPVNSSRVLDRAPEQIERLAGWINTEVFAIRKTGVRSLTVSLKIDERTEISLGLANHDGKIQALIQCERGDLSGVEHHWEQLQESLSRHDVQLLPLQPGNSSRATVSDFQSSASSHFHQQPHGQERGRSPEFSFDEMFSTNAVAGGKLNKLKNVTVQKGWESWA